MGKPILPRNDADPLGTDSAERRAMADFDRRMRQVARLCRDALASVPYTVVTVNAQQYQFELSPEILAVMTAEIDRAVDRILLEGGADQLWFTVGYVVPSYQAGTAAAWRNLGAQAERYKLGRPELASVLQSGPYRQRIQYLAARQFENMAGLTAETKASMARILTDGFAQGLNPRAVAKQLTDQAGIEARRGHRIARTEIGNALRQARLDEAQQAAADFGVQSRMMWFSALSPTTRESHRVRHGNLYGAQDVRVFYTQDGNAINCYLPGTHVAGRFVAGSKAHYCGPALEVVTASGKKLAVTPNHPILTPDGLRAAGELRKGDYLIANRLEVENSLRPAALDDQHRVPRIEDVFAALAQVGHSRAVRVRAVDFHGDAAGMHQQVDVVTADRPLAYAVDAPAGQLLDDLALEHADSILAHRGGSLFHNLEAVDLPPASRLGGLDVGLALLERGVSVPHERALSPVTVGQTVAGKPEGYRAPRNAEFSSERLDRLAGHVPGVGFFDIEHVGAVSRVDEPRFAHSGAHCVGGDAQLEGQGLGRLPGFASLDQIVDVRYFDFAGHVYDLEEVSGLMVANGIIASNCKCSQIEVLVDDRGEPLDPALVERVKAMRSKG